MASIHTGIHPLKLKKKLDLKEKAQPLAEHTVHTDNLTAVLLHPPESASQQL